jgi:hypothetical protein
VATFASGDAVLPNADVTATKKDATSTSVSGVVLFCSSSWRETTAPATANRLA